MENDYPVHKLVLLSPLTFHPRFTHNHLTVLLAKACLMEVIETNENPIKNNS